MTMRAAVGSRRSLEALRSYYCCWNHHHSNKKLYKSTFTHHLLLQESIIHHASSNTNTTNIDCNINTVEDDLTEWLLDTQPASWSRLMPHTTTNPNPNPNPFSSISSDLSHLTAGLRQLVSEAGHPLLAETAEYFFKSEASSGKKVRPAMCLLIARAIDNSVSPSQYRLAEISEMIHTASLFHDDVIDEAQYRRGLLSVNSQYGNKMAILAGDFLLARASIYLARLRNVAVVEVMSTIIEHLVKGEVMQAKSASAAHNNAHDMMTQYLEKNFYKTASLMAHSCQSSALLSQDASPEIVRAAYEYGKHVGVAFQLVDDVLDFEGESSLMGKSTYADLKAGIATAPVLFAARQYSGLYPLIERKFKQEGDVEEALQYTHKSDGIQKTKDLAIAHAQHAVLSLNNWLEPSIYRDALAQLAYKIVNRSQ